MGAIDEAGSAGSIFGRDRRAPATFLVERREASDGRREPEAWRVCGDGRAGLIHIAEGLGLHVDEVRPGFINEQIARKLAALSPNLDAVPLVGKAFETFYKDQCGQGVLLNAAGQQAVAPLAFVSNLAGALLALELVRFETPRLSTRSSYLTLDPWRPPTLHARRDHARRPECTYCGGEGRLAFRQVWPEIEWSSVPDESVLRTDTQANA